MALIKNTLLFGGWLPALLGGGFGTLWLTSDKTVYDALKRTGLKFLSTNKDFENIYNQYEDYLITDIPNIKNLKEKAVSQWCKDTLELSLSLPNIKEIIEKATKYCTEKEKIVIKKPKFQNFKDVVNLIRKTKVKKENMLNLMVGHLAKEENKDVYYIFGGNEELEKEGWEIIPSSRKNALSKKLYIDDKYEMLDFYKLIIDVDGESTGVKKAYNPEWMKKLEDYEKASPEDKFPDINNVFLEQLRDLRQRRTSTDLTTTNLLPDKCLKLLRKRFENKDEYDNAHTLFVKWCTKNN